MDQHLPQARFAAAFRDLAHRPHLASLFTPRRRRCELLPSWDDEFQNEQDTYEKLELLQGRVIPIFYGEAWFQGTRALILSEVQGLNSIKQGLGRLDWEEYGNRLKVACGELARYSVVLDG